MRLVLALGLWLAASAHGAASAAGPYVHLSGHFYVRPSFTFDISGTGSAYIGRTHWLAWSRNGATAKTTLFTDDCKPSCFQGHYSQQPARVQLSGLTTCGGKQVFQTFVVTDVDGRPLLQGDFRRLGDFRGC